MLEGARLQGARDDELGLAFTHGRLDGGAPPTTCSRTSRGDAGTALPLSVDLENGYGAEPERAARRSSRVAEAGAVGGSIEDWDPRRGIYPLAHAVERVAAACEAAHALDFPFTVTARAENLIRGNPDLDDTIARLLAYEQAGADVLFAPGLRDARTRFARCARRRRSPSTCSRTRSSTMREIVDAGAQRVSVGGALTWTPVAAMVAAAERMRDDGDFSVLGSSAQFREWLGRGSQLTEPGAGAPGLHRRLLYGCRWLSLFSWPRISPAGNCGLCTFTYVTPERIASTSLSN